MKQQIDPIVIPGRRIVLTTLSEKHIPGMFEYSRMPEFYRHMEHPPHQTIKDTEKYFERLMGFVSKGGKYWAIELKDENKLAGTVGIRNVEFDEMNAEAGMGISPHYWRTGIPLEALYLALNYCFTKLGFASIYATTSIYNTSAISILKNTGFLHQRILTGFYKKADGKVYDSYYFVVSKADFNENFNSNKLLKRVLNGRI
jgi:[ribosomal protein S5]-alanine N-acetyltransferase